MKKQLSLLLGLLLFLNSCAYQLEPIDEEARMLYYLNVNSVLVVPFIDQSKMGDAGDDVTRIFTTELARFSEVGIIHYETVMNYLKKNQLKITEENLVTIAKELAHVFNVETVIIGSVTEFDPYYPPVLGLSLELMSVATGDTLWTFGLTYDSNLNFTREALDEYMSTRKIKDSVYNKEVALRKKDLFIQFVSHEIIRKNL